MEFWSVPTFFVYGRLHSREKKDWEREKSFLYVLHHLRPYNTEREREKFCVRKLNFKIFIMPQWMNERRTHKFLCSFCSSCVLRETSIGVDYTQILKKKDCERKKEKCFPHHLRPTTEREKKYCVRNKNETVFKF